MLDVVDLTELTCGMQISPERSSVSVNWPMQISRMLCLAALVSIVVLYKEPYSKRFRLRTFLSSDQI
jgi:hypothetical protein